MAHVPMYHCPVTFDERSDTSLVLLMRECPNLQVLLICEWVSIATLLIMTREAKNLKKLHVRHSCVLSWFDWPRSSQWTDEYYQWLQNYSASFKLMTEEISRLLNTNWHMLSEHEYEDLDV